ncbi:MAG: 50S ribosomal protein L25/general stress protein Ctc [Solirubrobacteraceae bacterium]
MKSITIQGTKREIVGKKASKALRNAEQVPCVVYGNSELTHFSTDEKSFKDLVYTPDTNTVNIVLDGNEKIDAILKDVQFHPVSDKILHADFYKLDHSKPISIEIPVKLVGRAKGVANGGNLLFPMKKVKIKALPANLPDEIEIDVTPLKIGQKVYASALKNDKFTLIQSDNAVVLSIKTSRLAVKSADVEEEDNSTEVVKVTPIYK